MALAAEQLPDMYRRIVTIRTSEQKAVEGFHTGNIPGIVHGYIGQEAVTVVVCAARFSFN